MTNIFKKPEKADIKSQLFTIAVGALEREGWKVEKIPGSGKSSVRRITKGKATKVVSIRTTQDTWIAFPLTDDGKGWRTLDEVDAVVAVSVDDPQNAKFAKVHMIDGEEMRDRFNRAYAARMKAGYRIPFGRGIWVPLYFPEANDPVTHVGGGAGLKFPAIATVSLRQHTVVQGEKPSDDEVSKDDEAPLTISDAKRRLAATLGVSESNIKIMVEG